MDVYEVEMGGRKKGRLEVSLNQVVYNNETNIIA
jgi:hypothetical protein